MMTQSQCNIHLKIRLPKTKGIYERSSKHTKNRKNRTKIPYITPHLRIERTLRPTQYLHGERAWTYDDRNVIKETRDVTAWFRYIKWILMYQFLSIIYLDNTLSTSPQKMWCWRNIASKGNILGCSTFIWYGYINHINHQSLLDARNGWWASNPYRRL